MDETRVEEPRPGAARLLADVGDGAVAGPLRRVQMRGVLAGLRDVVHLAADAVRIADVPEAVCVEVPQVVVTLWMADQLLLRLAALEAPQGVEIRGEVALADAMGAVACRGQRPHEGLAPIGRHGRILVAARVQRVLPMDQAAAGGHTHRRRREGVGERHPGAAEPVQGRRADHRVPQGVDGVAALLIREEQEDIGAGWRGHSAGDLQRPDSGWRYRSSAGAGRPARRAPLRPGTPPSRSAGGRSSTGAHDPLSRRPHPAPLAANRLSACGASRPQDPWSFALQGNANRLSACGTRRQAPGCGGAGDG